MPTPTERTLEVIARSNEEVAVSLVVEALERDDQIGLEAVGVVSRHGNRRTRFELVRRAESLTTAQKDLLDGKTAPFADAINQALSGSVDADREAAYAWIDAVSDFQQYVPLLGRLPKVDEAEQARIVQVLDVLTDRIFDRVDGRTPQKEIESVRSKIFGTLVDLLEELDGHPYPEQIVEWALILSTFNHGDSNKVFAKFKENDDADARKSLLTSVHPGVLRVPLDLMRRSYPYDVVGEVLAQRSDDAFVHELLRHVPEEPTENQVQNLRSIESLPWLSGDEDVLSAIPESLRAGLGRLVYLLGLPEEEKQQILRWLLKHGDRETREIAASQFDVLDAGESHEILRDSLESDDAEIRAWATSMLRNQHVPDAFALLVSKLDSESEEVRQAARRELGDLNLRRALAMLELEPEKVTPSFGVLLKKIDPEICVELRRELAHSIRARRVAAIRVTGALGYTEEVMSAITALVEDSDTLVRRTAVELLGQTPSREALNGLIRATHDQSPRVRGAAIQSIQLLKARLKQQSAATAGNQGVMDDEAQNGAADATEIQASGVSS